MTRLPSIEEVERIIFELNGESTCVPDAFSGVFFQSCSDIVGEDIKKVGEGFLL